MLHPSAEILLPLLFGAAFVAGLIDAIAGGGGLITVPVLMAIGLPPQVALGTNKLQASFGSGSAMLHFVRAGTVKMSDCWIGILWGQGSDQSWLSHRAPPSSGRYSSRWCWHWSGG